MSIVAGQLVWQMMADDSRFSSDVKRGESMVSALGSVALKVGAVVGAIFAGIKTIDILSGFVREAMDAEVAATRLGIALKANGNIAGFSADQLSVFAGELQKVSTYGDDAIVSAMAVLASFRNVRGDVFTSTVAAAMDAAAATGDDLTATMERFGQALNDPIRGLQTLQREGYVFTDQQRQQIQALIETNDVMGAQRVMLESLSGRYQGAAAAMASTTQGKFEQIQNVVSDLAEEIGKVLLPWVDKVASWVRDNMPVIVGWVEFVADVIGNTLGAVLPWLWRTVEGFATYTAGALGTLVGIVMNLGSIWDYVCKWIGLNLSRLVDAAVWTFTEAIPEYLSWFAENWDNLFVDLFNATLALLKNLATNIGNVFSEVWDYIASMGEDKIDIVWKPLLDGFKATTQKLPELADMASSDLTKKLQGQLKIIGERIGVNIDETAGKWEDAVKKVFNPDPADLGLPDAPDPKLPVVGPTKDDIRDPEDRGEKIGRAAGREMKASIGDFYQSLVKFQTDLLKDNEDRKQTQLQGQMVNEQMEANRHLGEIAREVGKPAAQQPAIAG